MRINIEIYHDDDDEEEEEEEVPCMKGTVSSSELGQSGPACALHARLNRTRRAGAARERG